MFKCDGLILKNIKFLFHLFIFEIIKKNYLSLIIKSKNIYNIILNL